MNLLLILAIVLIVFGVGALISGSVLWGAILIIGGIAIGGKSGL